MSKCKWEKERRTPHELFGFEALWCDEAHQWVTPETCIDCPDYEPVEQKEKESKDA
jgi:hypothetical protein